MQYKVFGCKVNKYFTDKWLNSEKLKDSSGIFVASCVVTDTAKRKWVKFVKQNIEKLWKNDKMFISGCGAFEMGKENTSFFDIYSDLKPFQNKIEILPENPDSPDTQGKISPWWILSNNSKLQNLTSKLPWNTLFTKKFVLIQWGCDSYCTFCLTVQKRGKHFFRDKEDILEEILEAQRNEVKEVVLTWVNLCAWGLENTNKVGKSRFAELLTYILKNSDIGRIRISSLGPEFIDTKVLKIFENPRIYPHFHFSIQSWSSEILKAMRRHYDGIYMRALLQKMREIKRKDDIQISIWADIIVGFPGETEKDFQDTYALVSEFKIGRLHAFPFSSHDYGEHVPAHFYKNQVGESIKKERLHRLLDLWEKVRNEFIESQTWSTFDVLVEGKILWDTWSGWTQNYIEVDETNFKITSGEIKRGALLQGILLSRSQKNRKEEKEA